MRLVCSRRAATLALLIAPVAAWTLPASAQTADSAPGARYPDPMVDENAPPTAFLEAARLAIAAGRDGEAMEALERAESRALDRSVRPSRARTPSQQPVVATIAAARRALLGGERMQAVELVNKALAAEASESE